MHMVMFVTCVMVKVDKSKQYLLMSANCLPRLANVLKLKASVCVATKATTSITMRSLAALTLQPFTGQISATVMVKECPVEQYKHIYETREIMF